MALAFTFTGHRHDFRAELEEEVARGLARVASLAPAPLVGDDDLSALPERLQTYLRRTKAVGRPRPRSVHVVWRGRMRNGPRAPWMKVTAEQFDFFDEPARVFWMRASRFGLPFEGLHVYKGTEATMRVRAASLFDVVDAKGPEMTRSETVTLFNDMCLLAPGSLVGAPVEWAAVAGDARRLRGTFTNAGHTISAELTFDEAGDLVGFLSHDRSQSADGKTYRRLPWSTPVRDYVDFGDARVASRGDAVWLAPEGELVYGRFVIEGLELDSGAT